MSKATRIIRVGSRESLLAVAQTKTVLSAVARAHPEIRFELVTMKTQGDRLSAAYPTVPQPEIMRSGRQVVKGLFVKELEQALIDRRIDLAVHSLKDMALEPNPLLPVVAVSKRFDPRDVLVMARDRADAASGAACTDLRIAHGLTGGCSSPRRRIQLQKSLDCRVKPIRGNILTRIEKLDRDGEYDFLVLAAAGLLRADLAERISCYVDPEEILPAAGQGALACQGCADELFDYLACVHDEDTYDCVAAERAFAHATGGGCSSPVAAYAVLEGDELWLRGLYADEERGIYEKGAIRGARKDAVKLGRLLAEDLLTKGRMRHDG